ncbi:YceD family protein [Calothrix sp. PCC 6303]|uniref:YceD family protein n=1 Tax=Calothrix sp. PCC 6303 TaxID=1170562 RepID=UPI0002A02D0D|nr:YceD family protein [Calothrix sp. PCC 6303]AFZ03263.1 protein of unknown function DUF177 [Calothrix sp. PCC 6303]
MEAIYIPQLLTAPERTEKVQVEEFLPGLDTLTPVRGVVQVKHSGNHLQVFAQAEAIITCSCNRCLQQYNQRLTIDTSEIIWLDDEANEEDLPLEREVIVTDLVETLHPDGHFQPSEWLYEQMCLAIPVRQLCTRDCRGIQVNTEAEETESEEQKPVDSRWANLAALKKKISN